MRRIFGVSTGNFILFSLVLSIFLVISSIAYQSFSSNDIFDFKINYVNNQKLPYSLIYSFQNKLGKELTYEIEVYHVKSGEQIYYDSFSCSGKTCEQKIEFARVIFGDYELYVTVPYAGEVFTQKFEFSFDTLDSEFEITLDKEYYYDGLNVFSIKPKIKTSSPDQTDFAFTIFPKNDPKSVQEFVFHCDDYCEPEIKFKSQVLFTDYEVNIYSNTQTMKKSFKIIYAGNGSGISDSPQPKPKYKILEEKKVNSKYMGSKVKEFIIRKRVLENGDLSLATGDVNYEVVPVGLEKIKGISFEGLVLENDSELDLGVEEINYKNSASAFAIDPSHLEFSSAQVTATAQGNALYKCSGWDFTTQVCSGDWVLVKGDLVQGQEYEFTINSTDPAFVEVISISKADHLDSSKFFIEDVYSFVNKKDGDFATIPLNDYLRVSFEMPLENGNDITIYANGSVGSKIEVYEVNTQNLVGVFESISAFGKYKIVFNNLTGFQDTFDLKVLGGAVSFDYVVDPATIANLVLNSTTIYNLTSNNLTCNYALNDSSTTASVAWYKNGIPIMSVYLPFEGNSSNALLDMSGNGNNVTCVNCPLWNATRSYDGKGAFVFDGIDDNLSLSTYGATPNNSFTIMTFVNLSNNVTSQKFISRRSLSLSNEVNYNLFMNGTKFGFEFVQSVDNVVKVVNSTTTPVLNTRYHVAGVYNGTSMMMYVNGVLQGTLNGVSGPYNSSSLNLFVGYDAWENGNYTNGTLDDVRIYPYALSQPQILALSQNRINQTVSQNLFYNDTWQCRVTGFNSTEMGVTYSSNFVPIFNWVAVNFTLNATSLYNLTTDNLTCNYGFVGPARTSAVAWYKNGVPTMLLYLPMEGNSSNALRDYSGNEYTVSCTNCPLWNATGGFNWNGSYVFNTTATNLYLDVANINLTSGPKMFATWVKSKPGGVILNSRTATSNGIHLGIYNGSTEPFNCANAGEVCFGIAGSGMYVGMKSNRTINDGNWHYLVAFAYNLSDYNTFNIYIDGVNVTTTAPTVGSGNPSAIGLQVGWGSQWPWTNFSGTIDELRVYNSVLSSEQILAIYQNKTNTIVSQELFTGNVWQCRVTGFNVTEAGNTFVSNNISIQNLVIANLLLNATSVYNLTTDNLTCNYNVLGRWNTSSVAWYRNGATMMSYYLPMEGGSTNARRDMSGNGFIATCTNCPTWNATGGGDGNGSFWFDGVNDQLDMATRPFGSGNFTLSAWVKTTNTTGYRFAIGKAGTPDFGIGIFGGNAILEIGTGNCTGFGSIDDGNWHFMTLTRNGSNNSLFVDNSYVCDITDSSSLIDVNLFVGASAGSRYWQGDVDEVRVYKYVLSSAQLTEVYNRNIVKIVSSELFPADTWQCRVTGFNSSEMGLNYSSNILTVQNLIVTNVLLNATSANNLSTDNLTCNYVQAGSAVTSSIAWYKNGIPIMNLYLPFEGGSTNALKDYSGLNNHINFSNATWNSSGGFDGNGSFEFNGFSNFLSIPNNSSLQINGSFSISAWIKGNAWSSGFVVNSILRKGDISPEDYQLAVKDGLLTLFLEESDTAGTSGSTLLSTGVWYHVVSTWNTTDYVLYLNGLVEGFGAKSVTMVPDSRDIYVGGRPGDDYFNGSLDDVRVYNYSLSAEQVLALYNGGEERIVSQELAVGDLWQCRVTPFSSGEQGATVNSNILRVMGWGVLLYDTPYLNASSPYNLSNDTLTCNYATFGTATGAFVNWYKNGNPIMLVYYPFEGNSSNALLDMSGNNRTLDNPVSMYWNSSGGYTNSPGRIQSASLVANVTSQERLVLYNMSGFENLTKMTISFWTYPISFLSSQRLFDLNPEISCYVVGGVNQFNCGGLVAGFAVNTWAHVTLVYNGTHLLYYKNGAFVTSGANTIGTISNLTLYNLATLNRGYVGRIDEFRIYNYNLSVEQILALYNNQREKIVPPELIEKDVWQCRVTPFSGSELGPLYSSNNLTILPFLPSLYSNPILNATSPYNQTDDNLTCNYNLFGSTNGGIIAWFKNSSPMMKLYLPMEGNSSNAMKDMSGNEINFSCTNCPVWGSNFGFNGLGAFNWTAAGQALINVSPLDSVRNFTQMTTSVWIKPYSAGSGNVYGRVYQIGDTGGSANGAYNMYIYRADSRQIHCFFGASGVGYAGPITFNNWYHVACTWNGTNASIYINGVWNNTGAANFPSIDVPMNQTLYIGNRADGARTFAGIIDDLRFYNYSLSPEQIYAIYSDSSNIIVAQETNIGETWQCRVMPFSSTMFGNWWFSNNLTIVDSIFPQFYNFSDNNGTLYTYGTGVFNVSVNNTNGTVILSINGTNLSMTNITAVNIGGNSYQANFSFINFGNFTYFWQSYGNGSSQNWNRSESINYTVLERYYPRVNFTEPTPENDSKFNFYDNLDYFVANVTNLTSFDTVILYLFNSTGLMQSNSTVLTPFWNNYTSLVDGVYYVNATINNSISSLNWTETRVLTFDRVFPQINFTLPTPVNDSKFPQNFIEVNYSVVESNPSYSFVNLNRSLVAWYRFNGEAGENSTFVRDWSGFENNLTAMDYNDTNYDLNTTAKFTRAGRFGGAFKYDGVDDYFEAQNSSSLDNITTAITVSAWIKSTGSNYVVAKNSAGFDMQYGFVGGGGANMDVYLNAGGIRCSRGPTLGPGLWNHVAFTWNGSVIKIFVNGNQSGTDCNFVSTLVPTNFSLKVGKRNPDSKYMNGNIDEVMIFNRALSASEMLDLYNATNRFVNYTNLLNGTYTLQAFVSDIAGNVNMTEERVTAIGPDSPPVVNLTSPPDGYYNDTVQYPDLVLNASVVDDYALVNCSLWHNATGGVWALNQTLNYSGKTALVSFNLSGLSNVTFVWNVQCYDSTGNFSFAPNNWTIILNSTNSYESKNVSVWKVIYSIGNNLYSSNISVRNLESSMKNVTIIDFLTNNSLVDVFSLVPDFINETLGAFFNGNIMGWNLSLGAGEEFNISYNFTAYNYTGIEDDFVIGVE